MKALSLALLALLIAWAATAVPIQPGAVEVVDGDTIRVGGQLVRLVGFDTPEPGSQARCEGERTLAAGATSRLRQIVAGGVSTSGWSDALADRGPKEPKPATTAEHVAC